MPKIKHLPLLIILAIAFILRLYGVNWDGGFHLHPDERMLIMVAERINFFDNLNPQFFNYGTLPIYLLKGISQLIDFLFSVNISNYQGMLYVGRSLSITFDLLTIIFIYKITRLLFQTIYQSPITNFYLLPSFLYAIAFFPIQNSHFYTVDVTLTFLITLFVYLLLRYLMIPSMQRPLQRWYFPIMLGGVFGAMLATKFTAIIFLPFAWVVVILKTKGLATNQPRGLISIQTLINFLIFNSSLLIFNFIFMPYAFLDYKKFLADVLLQIKMNNNPYIFPYTLQYVGTLPYLYYIKNIFFWGLGPIISILSFIGFIGVIKKLTNGVIKKKQKKLNYLITNYQLLITVFFYLFYFLIIGRSAVKFMRYMLPIYPFLMILAGYGLYKIEKMSFLPRNGVRGKLQQQPIKNHNWIPAFAGMTIAVAWTLMFINIYSQPHTRITATDWMLKNIPAGSTLAVEHWDDRLPLYGGERYNFVELTLYDQPDDQKKWMILNEKLKLADYLIIASNRLYVPLQKLSDCSKYKLCYPKTAEYYKNLFTDRAVIARSPAKRDDEAISFQKVAEFTVYPQFRITNYQLRINDQSADESFTVYDHPRIMVFKWYSRR
jgi:hypothetical protein